jgi:hypothetical protein
MNVWRAALSVAATLAASSGMAACTAGGPAPPPARPTARSAAVSSTAQSAPAPSAPRTRTVTKVRAAPKVRSIRSVPERVDPLACTPPAPERPEIIAEVDPGDYPLAELTVTAEYSGDAVDERYRGTVRMGYDPDRKAFTGRLPPVSRANLPPTASGLFVTVRTVPDDQSAPPLSIQVHFASRCLVGS